MKIFSALVILLFCVACMQDRPSFSEVVLESVYQDSLSIRAIAPLDDQRVWFAANRGMVGLIDGSTPKLATIKYDDSLLNFRSIAVIKEAVFVLSIANPAVLYKIDFDGKEATHIEDVYSEVGPKVFYDSMKFWNDSEGIAMGDPIDGCLSVLITRDGGNHWTKVSCDLLPPVDEGEAAFAASNSNIATQGNHAWIATGGKRARVFHTGDRGESWEVYDTPIIQGRTMTGIYSIDFYNEKLGVIIGGDWEKKSFNEGNKAITRDGGKSWDLISNGEGPGYRSSVKFVPGSDGDELVAVGSPGISYSDDRGATWIELSKEGFYALEFVNDTVAFASGNQRIVKLIFR